MHLTLRAATQDDAERLFAWRNDPLTRAMSKDSAPLQWDAHLSWLSARLTREDPALFIVERAGLAVGTLRIDGELISYTVAPEQRGVGIATAMLKLARERFGPLTAEIRADNAASIKAAERAGHTVVLLPPAS